VKRPTASGSRGSSRQDLWGRSRLPGALSSKARLAPTLVKLERELAGVAFQGTIARMGEVSLLAFDPAKGSAGLVDLSATTDIELLQAGGHYGTPERQ
jgi:hypothetical protein